MPTKPNRAGNLQEYVPAGNGEASGEYGYNSGENKGGNKHFQAFKKPDGETKTVTPEQQPKQETKLDRYETNVKKLQEIQKKQKELLEQATINKKYFVYNYNTNKMEEVDGEYFNKWHNSWSFRADNLERQPIEQEIKELPDEFFEKFYEESEILVDLPSFNEEKDYLQLLGDSIEGKKRFLYSLGYYLNNVEKDVVDYKNFLILTKAYETQLNEYSQKINKILDPIRIKEGEEILKTFPKIKGEHTREDDLKKANVFVEDSATSINCQRCVFAYLLRRMGYDVVAKPNDDGYGRLKKWTQQMIYKEQHILNGVSYPSIRKQVREKVLTAPEGAIFALDVSWKTGGGHVFLVEKINGEMVFTDPQNVERDAEGFLKRLNAKKGVGLRRLDNASFTGSVRKTANPRKE